MPVLRLVRLLHSGTTLDRHRALPSAEETGPNHTFSIGSANPDFFHHSYPAFQNTQEAQAMGVQSSVHMLPSGNLSENADIRLTDQRRLDRTGHRQSGW